MSFSIGEFRIFSSPAGIIERTYDKNYKNRANERFNKNMKHINNYTTIYTSEEIQLANEIAERLEDPASLTQFLRYTKQVSHAFLRQALNKACSKPDHLITSSRAAIFVSSVKNHMLYGNEYTRD